MIFDSKYYPTLMFLLILSVLVITMFNIGGLLEKNVNSPVKNNIQENSPISGLVSLNINSSEVISKTKAISQMAYIYYYGIIGILFFLVYVLIKFIYKR